MALTNVLARLMGFLRAGYPHGIPAGDHVPLLALLRRRLCDEEVLTVAHELMTGGEAPIEATDVRVAITKVTDTLPSPQDTDRVTHRLVAAGWPVNDSFGPTQ